MTTSYEENVLKISGGYQFSHCHIVRAFVSIPELVRGDINSFPVKLATSDVPYTTADGQKYINPNDDFSPQVCLFVWMEGRDRDGVSCHWIVRFRLCDSNGFLRNQDFRQLDSLCRALTDIPDGFHDIYTFHLDYNDPLPRLSAVSRRLNSCRDAYFSAADAVQQTTPEDPMVEKPKTFHSWAFKREIPSVHFHAWADNEDLEFLNFGNTKPIKSLGRLLLDRLDYLHFDICLSVVSYGPDGEGTPRKADVYTPLIDIEPIEAAGGSLYEHPGLLPMAGFSDAIGYQLANWCIRRGYDQLAGLWRTTSSWGGSPYIPGPDFWTYWPTPVSPSVPFFGDDTWKRTNEIRGYWRVLPDAGADLSIAAGYRMVTLPKTKATPAIDKMIDFDKISEVKLAEKLSGERFQM